MTLYQLKTIVHNCAGLDRSPLLCYMSTGLVNDIPRGRVECLARARSEGDTLRCNAIEISVYIFINLFICYVRPLFPPGLLVRSW